MAHAAERKRGYRVPGGGVEIHIFFVAVGDEEVIAHPSFGQSRKFPGIEVQRDFLAGSKNRELVVGGDEQRKHIAVARVDSPRPGVRASGTGFLVDILHVAGRLIFDFQGKSVEIQSRARERNPGQTRALILAGAVDQDAVPIDL